MAVITVLVGTSLTLPPALDKVLWRALVVCGAGSTLKLLWWPEVHTIRLILPSGVALIGAALGRIAGGQSRSPLLTVLTAALTAVIFAFASSDLLGVGDYGAGPVVYSLVIGISVSVVVWLGRCLVAIVSTKK